MSSHALTYANGPSSASQPAQAKFSHPPRQAMCMLCINQYRKKGHSSLSIKCRCPLPPLHSTHHFCNQPACFIHFHAIPTVFLRSRVPRSSKVSVSRRIRILDPLKVFPLNQALDSSLHHVDVGLEALRELRDDFREEVLVGEHFASPVLLC